MRLIALVLFSLLSTPLYADDCPLFKHLVQADVAKQSTNDRLLEAVKRVRSIGGFTAPYIVCEWSGHRLPNVYSLINEGVMRVESEAYYVILAPPVIVERLSENALLGVSAHEHAHLFHGYAEYRRQLALSTFPALALQNEIATDKIATDWVGVGPVREGVNAVLDIAVESAEKNMQTRSTIEIDR